MLNNKNIKPYQFSIHYYLKKRVEIEVVIRN
jgi:hypothetical protein